jgi:hypothetical protein
MGSEREKLKDAGIESGKAPGAIARFLESPWAVAAILVVALALRFYRADRWSLWEDEETSIYFSQQLGKAFPRFFPLFFYALRGLYEITGVSVASARFVCATFGILSIYLTYSCIRKLTSREVALVAAFLLALNLGHLYWSQSIRYFIILFSFQLLSLYWFVDGMERGKLGLLLLSNLAFILCLLTHFSALLMTPVFIAYVFLMTCARQTGGAYNLRGYLTFGVPHVIILGFFVPRIVKAASFMSGAPSPLARDPLHVLITCTSYFGLPIVALSLLAPFVRPLVPKRILLFFLIWGFLPVLELVVIAKLNLSNVTWYNAFFSLAGLVALASMTLVSLYVNGFRRLALAGGGGAAAFAAVLLAGYYTVMHGDRPRWQDAALYLREEAKFQASSTSNPEIFATVPGVVAHHLGVPPGETMGNSLVRNMPDDPPTSPPEVDQWYVVESSNASPKVEAWLMKSCKLKATFAARTGPKDRSVSVYYCAARPPR